MPRSPEAQAREGIDRLLAAAGWHVCDLKSADIHAARGVALREFKLADGFGFADYMLYVNGKAAGVIEAKRVGATLTGVEIQSGRYSLGLPASLPAWKRPLPFLYEAVLSLLLLPAPVEDSDWVMEQDYRTNTVLGRYGYHRAIVYLR